MTSAPITKATITLGTGVTRFLEEKNMSVKKPCVTQAEGLTRPGRRRPVGLSEKSARTTQGRDLFIQFMALSCIHRFVLSQVCLRRVINLSVIQFLMMLRGHKSVFQMQTLPGLSKGFFVGQELSERSRIRFIC